MRPVDSLKAPHPFYWSYGGWCQAGRWRSGYILGADKAQVYSRLVHEGLHILYVRKASFLQSLWCRQKSRVRTSDVLGFLRQIVDLMKGGVHIAPALRFLSQRYGRQEKLHHPLADIEQRVNQGERFSDTLGVLGDALSPVMRAFIQHGDHTGRLYEGLRAALNDGLWRDEFRRKLRQSLRQPLIACVAVCVLLCVFSCTLVGTWRQVFGSMGWEIGWGTRAMLGFLEYTPFVLMLMTGTIVIAKIQRCVSFQNVMQSWPFLRKFSNTHHIYIFSYTLALGLENGLTLLEGVRVMMASEVSVSQKWAQHIVSQMEKGRSFSDALRALQVWPRHVVTWIQTAEKSQNFLTCFQSIARLYGQERDDMIQRWMQRLEPLILSVLALVMASLVGGLLYPLYRNMTHIS